MLYANFMAPFFIEPELLQIEVLHCGNSYFWTVFAPVTLTRCLIFIKAYELNPYPMEIGRSKMNFVLRGFRSCRIAYYRLRMRAFSYTRGHRSRDKGGGHTIRSAITINTKNATRKLHHRTGVIEDLHWGIGIFDLLLL